MRFTLASVVIFLLFFSGAPAPLQDCTNFAFLEQVAYGKVNNKSWKFSSGFANKRNILLSNVSIDMCTAQGLAKRDFIRINMLPQIAEGLFDIQSPPGQKYVVDVKNVWEGIPCYNCGACGRLEITKIDTVNMTISGKIDARWKDGDILNGSFTVTLCP